MNYNNKWFPYGISNSKTPDAKVFCFHYAGGSSSIFKHWVTKESTIEFIPIELPGRGGRIGEPCIENFNTLTHELIKNIIPLLDNTIPFFFFGHSMGAAIAFEVAYQLKSKYTISPQKIIVAGRHSPHKIDTSELHSRLSKDELITELRVLNGTPKEILDNKEIIDFLIPMIRSDLRLHESFVYQNQKLSIPIIAHAANQDIDATPAIMKHWQEVTRDECIVQEFEGDHFFVQNLGETYLNSLIEVIKDAIAVQKVSL
ncbi:thioesterase II family protein [Aquimarina sp. I32.4]|uniref:thioesterase II family protein n=1 Tax=Aquimarina sp. I32.4 TaxID=2053903 RepID=UPI000CDF1330|nr:thioesterase domain-containing protein [Aquimarina sp. I32.4]